MIIDLHISVDTTNENFPYSVEKQIAALIRAIEALKSEHGDPALKGKDAFERTIPDSEIQEIKRKEVERYDSELHEKHFKQMMENNLFDQFICPVCHNADCPHYKHPH